jgi:hypothetical protein
MPVLLPPTSDDLLEPSSRPYFLWWADATVGDLRAHLVSPDADERAYWTGALLREANTRDVWLFVTPDDVRAQWPRLQRHLGRSRGLWAYLLGLKVSAWSVFGAPRSHETGTGTQPRTRGRARLAVYERERV